MDYETNDRQQDQSSPVTSELVPVDKAVLLSSVLRTLARWVLIGLAIYAVGWLLWNGRSTLLPFAIGAILAFVLTPIVNRLGKHMPRWLAILTVYVAGLVVIILLFVYAAPLLAAQFQQIIDSFPSVSQMQSIVTDLLNRYRQVVPSSLREPINTSVNNAVQSAGNNLTMYMRSLLLLLVDEVLQIFQTITFIVGFVVVPFWLFYVLNSETSGRVFTNRILHPRLRPDFWNIWDIINDVLSNYVRGQLLLGVFVGSMVAVGMLILELIGIQVPYLLLLAFIAGITELIPYLGPVLGAVPGLLAGLLISPTTGLAMLAVYIIVQQFENNLLVPRIIGSHISIHPAILTIILFAAGGVFGLVGVFLAAPVAAISRDVFVYVYHRLQGETPEEVVLLMSGMH